MKAVLTCGFIIAFFTVVRRYEYLDHLSFMLLSGVTSATFIIIVPVTIIMSSLYDKSSQFCHNLSRKVHRGESKKSRQIFLYQLKSCPLIRYQVGGFYYMEAKAKLTLLHNILNGIVYLVVNVK